MEDTKMRDGTAAVGVGGGAAEGDGSCEYAGITTEKQARRIEVVIYLMPLSMMTFRSLTQADLWFTMHDTLAVIQVITCHPGGSHVGDG